MKATLLYRKREHGAVAIIVGLSLAVLIGFVGLALDLGRMFVTKTELQNAGDACALAGARELTTFPLDLTILTRAENAAMTVGRKNLVDFQAVEVTFIPDNSVTFSEALNGTYSTKGGASLNSKYVRCTVSRPDIKTWFMHVLNVLPGISIGDQIVSATAVATLAPSQSNCAVPLGVCKTPTGTAPDFGLEVGRWYSTKFQPGASAGSNPTGNFNWIDFNPSSETPGCPGGGASELACVMKGPGQCSLPPVGPPTCPGGGSSQPPGCVGQTGAANSLASAFNSRFGLYSGGPIQPADLTAAPPDFTGFAFDPTSWTLGRNAYGGTSGSVANFQAARTAHLAYQSTYPGYRVASGGPSGQLATYGADRRLVTVPIVDCPAYTPNQTVPILGYACVLLLNPFKDPNDDVRIEYLGRSNLPGSPCATSGAVGGSTSAGPLVPSLVQ